MNSSCMFKTLGLVVWHTSEMAIEKFHDFYKQDVFSIVNVVIIDRFHKY